jgi:Skp family chaperone for outer membrane proteins
VDSLSALFKKVQPSSQKARDESAKLAAELRKDVGDAEGREKAPPTKKSKKNPDEDTNNVEPEANDEVSRLDESYCRSTIGQNCKGQKRSWSFKGQHG